MTKAVGIQFEEDYILGVAIEKDTLELFSWIEINDADESIRKKKLKEFLKDAKVDSYHIAISLPARNAIWRKFNVPFTQEEEIEKIIAYESEQYIYSYTLEQLVIDYHILSSSQDQSRLLVSAVPKKTIQDTILWFEDCGVSPYIVELDISALLHTLPLLDAEEKEDILLLELHTKSCNIILLHKGEIKEIRAIPLKIDSFLGGVLADIHETTEINLKEETIALSPKLKNKILTRIKKELTRTLLVTASYVHVYFCGDPDLTKDLPNFFRNNFSLNASLWKATQKFSKNNTIYDKTFGKLPVAIGLALKALGETKGGFNLRKEEFQFQTFDAIKKKLARTLTLLFLFLFLASFGLLQRLQEKKNLYIKFLDIAKEKQAILFPEDNHEIVEYWEKIRMLRERIEIQIELSRNALPEIPDALKRCTKLLERLLPCLHTYYFTIESIRIETQEIVLEGRAQNDLFFDVWKKSLEGISWIDPGEDSIKLLESRYLPSPKNTKLPKFYKFWVKLR